jgi:hypothetical protein
MARRRLLSDEQMAPFWGLGIGLTGDYVWSAKDQPAGALRPLRQRQSLLAA